MRKLRWLIAGLIVIIPILLVYAGCPKSDKIDALRPYIYREQISYTTMALGPGLPPRGYQQHIYWLHGIDAGHLMQLLKEQTKKMHGATINSFPTKDYFSFHASDSAVTSAPHDLVAMSGAPWLPMETSASVRKQIAYTVLDEVPLTKWQVLMYKMSHPNHNPFSM